MSNLIGSLEVLLIIAIFWQLGWVAGTEYYLSTGDAISCGEMPAKRRFYFIFQDDKKQNWKFSSMGGATLFFAHFVRPITDNHTSAWECYEKSTEQLYDEGRFQKLLGTNSDTKNDSLVASVPDAIQCGTSDGKIRSMFYLASASPSGLIYAHPRGPEQPLLVFSGKGAYVSRSGDPQFSESCIDKTIAQIEREKHAYNFVITNETTDLKEFPDILKCGGGSKTPGYRIFYLERAGQQVLDVVYTSLHSTDNLNYAAFSMTGTFVTTNETSEEAIGCAGKLYRNCTKKDALLTLWNNLSNVLTIGAQS